MSSVLLSSSLAAVGSDSIVAVKVLPQQAAGSSRGSFHLALLLDVSGSMDGQRLTTVKRTMHLLIDALAVGDKITIISYESSAKIRANAVVITPEMRAELHTIVDGLVAEGGTNIEAAFGELATLAGISAVFLLTDGMINNGISTCTGLLRIMNAAIAPGTPLNTLGYGADHNSRLLRDMAMKTRGSYTFADADEMIPAIIGDIIAGLASEVGRLAKLQVPEGWTCVEQGAEGDSFTIGTLIADKDQFVVFKAPAGTVPPTRFELTWTGGDGSTHTCTCECTDAMSDVEICEQYDRARIGQAFREVSDLLEDHKYDDAVRLLEDLQAHLESSIAKDRPLVVRLRAQIDDMVETIRMPPAPPTWGLPGAGGGRNGGFPLAPMLSRLASNTAAVGLQRGFLSANPSAISGASRRSGENPTSILEATFSSPAQRHATGTLITEFNEA